MELLQNIIILQYIDVILQIYILYINLLG